VTINEFQGRLATAGEGQDLFSALRRLTRLEPGRLASVSARLIEWTDWYAPSGTATGARS
jgi:hypothetical protein